MLRRFADEVFATHEDEVVAALRADVEAKHALEARVSSDALISAAARGFVYEREPEASRVVLAPQLAARPWLLLCQHRDARIVCYPAAEPLEAERDVRERALLLGRALADEGRVQILRRLSAGEASLSELTDADGAGEVDGASPPDPAPRRRSGRRSRQCPCLPVLAPGGSGRDTAALLAELLSVRR